MTDPADHADRLLDLAGAVCDDCASESDAAELDSMVVAQEESGRLYWDYCWMHVMLEANARTGRAMQKVCGQESADPSSLTPWESDALQIALSAGPATESSPPTVFAPLVSPQLHGSFLDFSFSGWPAAYLIATVIFAIGALIGAFITVSRPVQIASDSPSAHLGLQNPQDEGEAVGHISGMVGCKWEKKGGVASGQWLAPSEGREERGERRGKAQGPRFKVQGGKNSKSPNPEPRIPKSPNPQIPKSLVFLGDQFILSAGLMEITYNTGARVILQGPCTFEVDSAAGGFLTVGKLTARVESGGRGSSKVQGPRFKTGISPNPEIPKSRNPSLTTNHYPLFTIKTPTALITDLGTEFGVEVGQKGDTFTHVFRGIVRVETTRVGESVAKDSRVLRENESAQITGGADRVAVVDLREKASAFIRRISPQDVKVFDLVDVVAGGDGFSGRRGRGIDPTNGQISDVPNGSSFEIHGDHQYHRVESIPLVDGVFIPDGSKEPVQIDSAGHVFPDCPATDNRTWINLWAGGRLPESMAARMATALGGVDYFSPEHAALFLHANTGITFDLDAIRRANPGHKLVRFRSMAGNMEPETEKGQNVFADVWVLVDGQVRFKRREINHLIGAMPIHIPIDDRDRFLTLAATDGGNSYTCDLIIFGDPRLELVGADIPVDHNK